MNFDEGFRSIKTSVETKIKVKGSLFNCYSFPVSGLDEAHVILENIRKEHYDATHHCYALQLKDSTFKYSDDGEPNGTAGIRILNAIQHFDLKNILVVVVRYFGGTKLGVGLLGKTYYEAAEYNLSNVEFVDFIKYQKLEIKINFDDQGIVYKIFKNLNCIITNTTFQENLSFEVLVPPTKTESLKVTLTDATKGKISINNQEIVYCHR